MEVLGLRTACAGSSEAHGRYTGRSSPALLVLPSFSPSMQRRLHTVSVARVGSGQALCRTAKSCTAAVMIPVILVYTFGIPRLLHVCSAVPVRCESDRY